MRTLQTTLEKLEWYPIPTYTVRDNSKVNRRNAPYKLHNLREYLTIKGMFDISIEAFPQEESIHIEDLRIINGNDLTFHISKLKEYNFKEYNEVQDTGISEITEYIRLNAIAVKDDIRYEAPTLLTVNIMCI